MSDHAAVTDEHRKLTTQIYAARSRYECGAATNMETDADAQLLADFARDEQLKALEDAAKVMCEGCKNGLVPIMDFSGNYWHEYGPITDLCKASAIRIEQLKRGEL